MPLTFPSNIIPSRAQWQLVSNTKTFKSPLDGSIQTSELAGARWHVSLSFPNQMPREGRVMMAFLAALKGESGRFLLHDQTQPSPQGTITGSPVVAGAAQVGASIVTSGWNGTLMAGDMINIGNELKIMTADVVAGASTVIQFEPPLRQSPVSGSPILIHKPSATFKLTGDNQASYSVSPFLYGLNIICEEVF